MKGVNHLNIIQFRRSHEALAERQPDEAKAREALDRHYGEYHERLENGRSTPREYDPETFAALLDYLASKDQPTPNADGVHVGDLLYSSWGWEQTNIDFYQVVALKGKHTIIIRKIAGEYVGGYSWSGKVRPLRNHFVGDTEYTVRTKTTTFNGEGWLQIKDPVLSGHHCLSRTTDFKEHDYSSYA